MIVRGVLLSFLLCMAPAQADTLPEGLIRLDGRPAPALRLADLDGKTTDLAVLRGQWVMVHFWASWCGPCRRELPAIAAMAQTKPAALALVMVNTAETEDEVFAFLASVAPALSTLLDKDGQVTERWQPRGLPSTFLSIPGDGCVIWPWADDRGTVSRTGTSSQFDPGKRKIEQD